jgi:toxin FitB
VSGFLLDTNIPSELVRPRPESKVTAWLAAQSDNTRFLSVIMLGVIHKGFTLQQYRT